MEDVAFSFGLSMTNAPLKSINQTS